jgi:1,4-alpha-glucan branching enzyme
MSVEGSVGLVLHAHLPPTPPKLPTDSPESQWFADGAIDTYLPLLRVLERLDEDAVPGRITVSLSAPLLGMFADGLHRKRLAKELARRVTGWRELAERWSERPTYRRLAGDFAERLETLATYYDDALDRDIPGAFGRLWESGRIELITGLGTAASLALLPDDAGRRAHGAAGIDLFRERFGAPPPGLWMVDCGHHPALEPLMAERGVRYALVDERALRTAVDEVDSCYTPMGSHLGVAYFGTNGRRSWRVVSPVAGAGGRLEATPAPVGGRAAPWESLEGFPSLAGSWSGDPVRAVHWRSNGRRIPLDSEAAQGHAQAAAARFVRALTDQLSGVSRRLVEAPYVLCVFRAESFGCPGPQGLWFLEAVLREAARLSLPITSPSDYLDENREIRVGRPASSTSSPDGFLAPWLDGGTVWLLRYLHRAERRLEEACRTRSGDGEPSSTVQRLLHQAGRELLLAECGDWAQMLRSGRHVDFALERVTAHLEAVDQLLRMLDDDHIDSRYLRVREKKWGYYAHLDIEAVRAAERP